MNADILNDLAARVEALAGADRSIDRLIALACLGYTEDRHYPSGLVDERGHVFFGFPAFTSSFDAAMGLAIRGHSIRFYGEGAQAIVVRPFSGSYLEVSRAMGFADAAVISAAWLRAHAAIAKGNEGG